MLFTLITTNHERVCNTYYEIKVIDFQKLKKKNVFKKSESLSNLN